MNTNAIKIGLKSFARCQRKDLNGKRFFVQNLVK